jgi:threonine synthase
MAKMRKFLFWNESGDEKEKEALSLKKAVMSVQGDFKDKVIGVEYVSKKGKNISTSINIPVGRKIRQSIILEQKRLAAKAAREANRR